MSEATGSAQAPSDASTQLPVIWQNGLPPRPGSRVPLTNRRMPIYDLGWVFDDATLNVVLEYFRGSDTSGDHKFAALSDEVWKTLGYKETFGHNKPFLKGHMICIDDNLRLNSQVPGFVQAATEAVHKILGDIPLNGGPEWRKWKWQ